MTEHLGKQHSDWSVYLPALSGFYSKQLQNAIDNPGEHRVPADFEYGLEGLDFLKEDSSYFHYPWCLYSAGHAELDLNKAAVRESMVHARDRNNTMLLGDSGGFQIASGVLKMDWTTAINPNDPAREAVCEKILRWLESTADWSMTLDVPAFAATGLFAEKTGLTKFQDTLDISEHNLRYFLTNRVPGATKFLNVLSGSDVTESKVWYDRVKKYNDPKFTDGEFGEGRALEGYAFAGVNMRNMPCLLNRLLDLREDGLLEGKNWIHFLGIGKLDWACHLTAIQRQLRKWDNPNITLSFDAASPFVNVAYGQTYTVNSHTNKKFSYHMDRAIDNKDLAGSNMPMPWRHSPIMSRLTVGDICVQGHGALNKQGKESRTSWDTWSYAFYMAHSVYNHITAVQEANRLADIERHRAPVDFREWRKTKKGSSINETSPYVPGVVLMFAAFAEEVLDPKCPDPRGMIEEYRSFLDEISFGGYASNTINTFFEIDEYVEGSSEKDMMEPIMRGEIEE
jgi:hypothetical protein